MNEYPRVTAPAEGGAAKCLEVECHLEDGRDVLDFIENDRDFQNFIESISVTEAELEAFIRAPDVTGR